MNRHERKKVTQQRLHVILELSKARDVLKTMNAQLEESLTDAMSELDQARELIAQLTRQIQDSSRSYMWTLAALAKSNGGTFRIPGSAIDSVREDDIIENRLDEDRDEIVFTLRHQAADVPSGIILPGRIGR